MKKRDPRPEWLVARGHMRANSERSVVRQLLKEGRTGIPLSELVGMWRKDEENREAQQNILNPGRRAREKLKSALCHLELTGGTDFNNPPLYYDADTTDAIRLIEKLLASPFPKPDNSRGGKR